MSVISLFFSLKRRAKVLRLPQTHKENREKTEFVSKNNAWFLQSLLFKGVFPKLNLFHHAELRGCTFMQGSPSSLLYVWHIHFFMSGVFIISWLPHSKYFQSFKNNFATCKIFFQTFKIFFETYKTFCLFQSHTFVLPTHHSMILQVIIMWCPHSSILLYQWG